MIQNQIIDQVHFHAQNKMFCKDTESVNHTSDDSLVSNIPTWFDSSFDL